MVLHFQVRKAETWLQAGNEDAFLHCIEDLIESQCALENASKQALVCPPTCRCSTLFGSYRLHQKEGHSNCDFVS